MDQKSTPRFISSSQTAHNLNSSTSSAEASIAFAPPRPVDAAHHGSRCTARLVTHLNGLFGIYAVRDGSSSHSRTTATEAHETGSHGGFEAALEDGCPAGSHGCGFRRLRSPRPQEPHLGPQEDCKLGHCRPLPGTFCPRLLRALLSWAWQSCTARSCQSVTFPSPVSCLLSPLERRTAPAPVPQSTAHLTTHIRHGHHEPAQAMHPSVRCATAEPS
jgi:hypothetical protein